LEPSHFRSRIRKVLLRPVRKFTAPNAFANPFTTVNGQGTKIATISTIPPSDFYAIALGSDAVVTANGLVNFAPSTVRKLLRASDTAALDQVSARITASVSHDNQSNGQQGGFSIGDITLASADETSGAEAPPQ
jgi:hypothetical protein